MDDHARTLDRHPRPGQRPRGRHVGAPGQQHPTNRHGRRRLRRVGGGRHRAQRVVGRLRRNPPHLGAATGLGRSVGDLPAPGPPARERPRTPATARPPRRARVGRRTRCGRPCPARLDRPGGNPRRGLRLPVRPSSHAGVHVNRRIGHRTLHLDHGVGRGNHLVWLRPLASRSRPGARRRRRDGHVGRGALTGVALSDCGSTLSGGRPAHRRRPGPGGTR